MNNLKIGIRNQKKNIISICRFVKQKNIIDMSADRGEYICQSQSLNLFIESPSIKVLTSMHFYAWESGLKTGMYYLRSKPAGQSKKITVEEKPSEEAFICSLENPENCDMCGS